jgi:hypothetical protein
MANNKSLGGVIMALTPTEKTLTKIGSELNETPVILFNPRTGFTITLPNTVIFDGERTVPSYMNCTSIEWGVNALYRILQDATSIIVSWNRPVATRHVFKNGKFTLVG